MAASTMEVDVITSTERDILSIDNTPTPQVLSKYRLAGHFCSAAMKAVIEQCVAGANCTRLCQFGDEVIVAQVQMAAGSCINGLRLRMYSSRMSGGLQNPHQSTSITACADTLRYQMIEDTS